VTYSTCGLRTAAEALERPLSSVAADRHRGMAKLKALANAPEEAEPAGRSFGDRRR
jgi:hypothetical protein